MAIKVALAAALLVALVAVSGATTYTTTVTTTSDEANPRQQCQQVVQQRQFRACQEYLSPFSQYQEEIGMRSVSPRGQEQLVRDACCQSLKEMERQGCECEAIQKAAREVQQMMGQGQGQQMYDKAQRLPQTCNLRTQRCPLQVVFL